MKRIGIIGIGIVYMLSAMLTSAEARHKVLRERRHVAGVPQWRGWRGHRGWSIRSKYLHEKRSWSDWQGSGGWGYRSEYQKMYDPKKIAKVKGVVEKVELITPRKGMSNGIHLKLKTDSDVKSIHLGPSWFIKRQEVEILKGDTIEATGSKVEYKGKPVMIASMVKKGDSTLMLRDENGRPRWSGARRD